MQTPVYTIASNAGVEGAVVVGKLLEESDPDKGYDAAKGQWIAHSLLSFSLGCVFICTNLAIAWADEYVDMVKAGIIDPVKVIRTALVDAAR